MRFQLQYLRWQRRMRLCPIIIGFPYSLPSCSLYILLMTECLPLAMPTTGPGGEQQTS